MIRKKIDTAGSRGMGSSPEAGPDPTPKPGGGDRRLRAGKGKGKEDSVYGAYFLGSVIILYLLLTVWDPDGIVKALRVSGTTLVQIVPVILMVILVMGLMNYFIDPKAVSKYVGKGSGTRGMSIAISTGILSHGPIYVWYPLLRDLRDHGMSSGLAAVFLYNRGIKLPLLPLFVFYFGSTFAAILLLYMVLASIIEGKIIESIVE